MLTTGEMKEATIPEQLLILDEELNLNWRHYDEKLAALIKFAIRVIFGKSNDTIKFVAVCILKK